MTRAVTLGLKPKQTGNVTQRRFRLTGNGPRFDNHMKLNVFDTLFHQADDLFAGFSDCIQEIGNFSFNVGYP